MDDGSQQVIWAGISAAILFIGVYLYREGKSRALQQSKVSEKPTVQEGLSAKDYLDQATQALTDKEYAKAKKLALTGIEASGDDIRIGSGLHNLLGSVLATEGKMKEAFAEFKKASEVDPSFSYPFSNLGNLYFIESKFKEAEEAYKEAIHLNDQHADAYNNLGILYKTQKRTQEAIQNFERALKLDPKMEEAQRNLEILKSALQN
ncbi:MAG: tetratricopeptide repeat protein [Candidatus Nitrohelix vancouverensis]|uniref:Tetratricopeptide repeat protein n=1 Tax=Candidatus Nitrohelix vancouverensis TaxID=2705534 RepID=A0A7T0C359_9BACT|nr:MAG: tetratricopeptide repeat protein [Candidatus Nitrohelix vancouverensis]